MPPPRVRARGPAALERIVVATDFSPAAVRILRRLALLPLHPAPRIEVLHVLPERPAKEPERANAAALLAATARSLARNLARAGYDARGVVGHLRRGRPFVEIVRVARTTGAELVVLGRHGRRPLRDRFLGSTAERVAQHGDTPVLLVNRPARRRYDRALVALDLDRASSQVAGFAPRVLGARATATVLHVYHVPYESFVVPPDSPRTRARFRAGFEARAAVELEPLVRRLEESRIRVRTLLRTGEPREIILREAARLRSDVLVLGTHARSGVVRSLLGSVAGDVLREAGTDVLLVRPRWVRLSLP